jgi:predicted naringenin-chalcone synthase
MPDRALSMPEHVAATAPHPTSVGVLTLHCAACFSAIAKASDACNPAPASKHYMPRVCKQS